MTFMYKSVTRLKLIKESQRFTSVKIATRKSHMKINRLMINSVCPRLKIETLKLEIEMVTLNILTI
jgi:hypothetical protein